MDMIQPQRIDGHAWVRVRPGGKVVLEQEDFTLYSPFFDKGDYDADDLAEAFTKQLKPMGLKDCEAVVFFHIAFYGADEDVTVEYDVVDHKVTRTNLKELWRGEVTELIQYVPENEQAQTEEVLEWEEFYDNDFYPSLPPEPAQFPHPLELWRDRNGL